jgi:hypothetical protein
MLYAAAADSGLLKARTALFKKPRGRFDPKPVNRFLTLHQVRDVLRFRAAFNMLHLSLL